MHSPHSNISISLNQLWKQLKVWNLIYIASTQISQTALFKSHIINQIEMRLWIYSTWGKPFLYLRTWKTGEKVISLTRTMMRQSFDSKHRHPTMRWTWKWKDMEEQNGDSHIWHPIQKGRTQKNKKESAIPRNFKILSGNINKSWSPETNPLWITASHLWAKAPPWESTFHFHEDNMCCQPSSFFSLFPNYRTWHPQPSFN